MKPYVLSLMTGVLAGIIYSLLQERSPAPPVIALLGLFGMLVGEQIVPTCRRLIARQPLSVAWFRTECLPKIGGTPPATKTPPRDPPSR